MFPQMRVAAVLPCFSEARRLPTTLSGLPDWLDRVYVIDDASPDRTADAALGHASRPTVIRHPVNQGVGAAIRTGYMAAAADGCDVAVVLAGDNQMDPADLGALLNPIARGTADYVKGNRLAHPERRAMPWQRRIAGKGLGFVTRVASGYPIDDSQCGYTALALAKLPELGLEELWPRYGYPNDLLLLAARAELRVAEVPVRPVYQGEASGIRPWHAALILGLVARRRWQRRTGPLPQGATLQS